MVSQSGMVTTGALIAADTGTERRAAFITEPASSCEPALSRNQPMKASQMPFTTLTGLVDCDHYHDAWVHFPARWHDANFNGVLPKGTPVAQCFPVKRENWSVRTAVFTEEETQRAHDLTNEIFREKGVYRRQYRS